MSVDDKADKLNKCTADKQQLDVGMCMTYVVVAPSFDDRRKVPDLVQSWSDNCTFMIKKLLLECS